MNYSSLNFAVDDLLDRKVFVKNLMQVINEWEGIKHENDSLVISVDAPWGSGKSYLLNMWKNWLISEENSDKNYCTTYYNAWENDDIDNPFIPLVYKLQNMDVYGENEKLLESIRVKSIGFLKSCSIALLKDGIKKIIGDETANIISEAIEGAKEADVQDFFEQYSFYVAQKEKFREALLNLVPENGKLLVFVDELDRCRPTFAIETLEIVKHFFNISNIVFIFAVDLEQLAHSIETMYGNGMDSAGYLRRFFDVNISIPSGDMRKYVINKLKACMDRLEIPESFIDTTVNIYTKLHLSLRDIDIISNNFMVFCMYYKDIFVERIKAQPVLTIDALEVYLYFITLKYKYPNIYYLIIKQEFIAYDNSPKNWSVLEMKYFVSKNINKMLKEMQTGGAQKKDDTLVKKYGLYEINTNELSFAEHIERTIEMFS